eukprot:1146914-Pelagomonas_calceolata.AAC.27
MLVLPSSPYTTRTNTSETHTCSTALNTALRETYIYSNASMAVPHECSPQPLQLAARAWPPPVPPYRPNNRIYYTHTHLQHCVHGGAP